MLKLTRRAFAACAASLLAVPAQAAVVRKNDIDYIQVRKADRKLDLVKDKKIVKTYDVQLGGNPVGHKQFQGDRRTPEGIYHINGRNPHSRFHRSLRVSYPNRVDLAFAARRGKSAGGDIFIHGQPNGQKFTNVKDWTWGCIALANNEMDELWALIPQGCPILIRA